MKRDIGKHLKTGPNALSMFLKAQWKRSAVRASKSLARVEGETHPDAFDLA